MACNAARTALAALLLLALGGCEGAGAGPDAANVSGPDAATLSGSALLNLSPGGPPANAPRFGLMTSLPLFWPIGAELAQLAQGTQERPWPRRVIEQIYRIQPLDTLSPIAPLAAGEPEIDPLAGLTRLAVIQPRGLSPADNVALDRWVRAGGALLLVLDPALTGEYEVPLGDPRHPVATALIPPVVKRWGLSVQFDERQAGEPRLAQGGKGANGRGALPLILAGEWVIAQSGAPGCTLQAEGALAVCRIGQGRVTLMADAALFEHPELAGEQGEHLLAVLERAFP